MFCCLSCSRHSHGLTDDLDNYRDLLISDFWSRDLCDFLGDFTCCSWDILPGQQLLRGFITIKLSLFEQHGTDCASMEHQKICNNFLRMVFRNFMAWCAWFVLIWVKVHIYHQKGLPYFSPCCLPKCSHSWPWWSLYVAWDWFLTPKGCFITLYYKEIKKSTRLWCYIFFTPTKGKFFLMLFTFCTQDRMFYFQKKSSILKSSI